MCMCVYMYTERLVGHDCPSRRVEAVRMHSWYALESRLSSNERDVLRCFNQARFKIRAGQVEAQVSVDRFTLKFE